VFKKLARYLIEPREKERLVYNEFAEKKALDVFQQLFDVVGSYSLIDSKAQESAILVIV